MSFIRRISFAIVVIAAGLSSHEASAATCVWKVTTNDGRSLYLGPVRKFVLCLCPALLAGAVLTLALANAGELRFLPGMWLLLYGCAVLSASTVTATGIARLICLMGALFVALGSITFALPAAAHTIMLGLGFGVVHIIFGVLIGRHSHDG